MTHCVDLDVEGLSNAAIEAFEKKASQADVDPCLDFNCAVQGLIGACNVLFAMTARACKTLDLDDPEEELDQVAALWEVMENACSRCLSRVVELSGKYTNCPSEIYTDELLDMQSSCRARKELHQ